MKDIFLKLMFNIFNNYMTFTTIHHFHLKEMKIEKIGKFVVAILHDKKEYVIHMWNLKQPLNHGLLLKNVDKTMKLHQDAWLKPYIDMNTELKKNAKK